MPADQEFGVLNHQATEQAVFGTVARRFEQAVQTVDPESKEVTSQAVERVNLYPFGVKPSTEVLELYGGPASGIEEELLEAAACEVTPASRLSCQITMTDALDGLVVRLPETQF